MISTDGPNKIFTSDQNVFFYYFALEKLEKMKKIIPHSSASLKEKESICLLYEQKENVFVGRSCAYSLAELPFSQNKDVIPETKS